MGINEDAERFVVCWRRSGVDGMLTPRVPGGGEGLMPVGEALVADATGFESKGDPPSRRDCTRWLILRKTDGPSENRSEGPRGPN